MNQLVIIGLLLGITVIGLAFISGAAANPSVPNKLPSNTTIGAAQLPPIVDGKQDLFLRVTQYGTYDPAKLRVKKGVPVRIHYSADEYVGCGREVIFPEFNVRKSAPLTGETLIEFTPTKSGKFSFNCWMNMFKGVIEVVD